MTNITSFVSDKTSKNTLTSAWFSMITVALVTIVIGFAAGYSAGFGQAYSQIEQSKTPGDTILVDYTGE